jgi:hypothetical protein
VIYVDNCYNPAPHDRYINFENMRKSLGEGVRKHIEGVFNEYNANGRGKDSKYPSLNGGLLLRWK